VAGFFISGVELSGFATTLLVCSKQVSNFQFFFNLKCNTEMDPSL
jgi:hypothetical protein